MTTPTPLPYFHLAGQTALVTGCSRGLGRAICVALAGAGANIIGTVANERSDVSAVRSEVENLNRRFTAYRCDLADTGQVSQLTGQLAGDAQQVDILVNNAGTIRRQPASEHTDAFWQEVLQVNLTSAFQLSRELGRRMIERRRGKIIFIASLLSFQGGINVPGYAASKGGIAQLTKALANEWARHGVNVNAIAPGYMATDNTTALRADPVRSSQILERIPAGRWGNPSDLQGAAVFLASSASDYVHGTVLTVDGGWMGR